MACLRFFVRAGRLVSEGRAADGKYARPGRGRPRAAIDNPADNRRLCRRSPAVSIPAFAPRLAFVDVETTGSSPTRERVTEIGVVRVDIDGESTRIDEWSTLVNPGVPIPPEIEWLTGITNAMVRGARSG
jgi:DNA polymerase III epsilon subunit-like protein